MRIYVEKGRMLSASCHWVHFILRNTDIMTTLNKAPLFLSAEGENRFRGKIYGVTVNMEVLGEREPTPSGEINIVSDVRMPFKLGRTHTVAHYRYRLVDTDMTAVDLQMELETTGIIMSIYAALRRRNIDAYLNRVLSDNERAAVLIQENDSSLNELLSEEQLTRIASFRATYGEKLKKETDSQENLKPQPHVQDKPLWDTELSELSQLYTKFYGQESGLENELNRIRETRDAVAALLIARRMLEVVVTHVCRRNLQRERGTEPLGRVIEKITRAGCIPEYVTTSMANLNRLSTYGAHPKEFSPRQVREALMALCSIIEWYAKYCQQKEKQNQE